MRSKDGLVVKREKSFRRRKVKGGKRKASSRAGKGTGPRNQSRGKPTNLPGSIERIGKNIQRGKVTADGKTPGQLLGGEKDSEERARGGEGESRKRRGVAKQVPKRRRTNSKTTTGSGEQREEKR